MNLEPEMEDGYPTDETLKLIAEWPYTQHRELMKFLQRAWHFGDWGWSESVVAGDDDKPVHRYEISTGGWSGNESLIGAMQDNRMFWMLCWQQSQRGGHYIFEVRL